MKFSHQWLGRFVDLTGVPIAELSDQFTRSVAELEGVESFGDGLSGVMVARVEEVKPHPNADRLVVCTVADGSSALRQVVCGAPNVQPGMITALAPPGVRIGETVLGKAAIRGVESAGMLCSAAELKLTDDGRGICSLDQSLTPGTPLSEVVPLIDYIFEVDNKSITHRPDLWGHAGIAREMAALLKRPFRIPPPEVAPATTLAIATDVQAPKLCPRYVTLRVTGLQAKPSPLWMQAQLHRCGIRPINIIVDVTNYVMLDFGNPLHAFDAREIRSNCIVVRTGKAEGERVVALDGKPHDVSANDLLICDGERPVALAGIMGLKNSEVRDDTTTIIIESATFDAATIRKTSVRLGFRTEASARFEKSLDPSLPPIAAKRCAEMLVQLTPGARIDSALGDFAATLPPRKQIDVSFDYVNQRLGVTLPQVEICDSLQRLEFEVDRNDGQMRIVVPTFRATKDISIPEDIVEEIGRIHGYGNIAPAQPHIELPVPFRDSGIVFRRGIRMLLTLGQQFNEAQTYSFDYEPFVRILGAPAKDRVKVRNPINADHTHLRPRIMPGLLRLLQRSFPYARELDLYEIGRVFLPPEGTELVPVQPFHLALVSWRHTEKSAQGSDVGALAFFELKGRLEGLFARMGLAVRPRPVASARDPWFHPVRSADFVSGDGVSIGTVGQLHPGLKEVVGGGSHLAVAELDLEAMQQAPILPVVFRIINRQPEVPFDISIVVDNKVTHETLSRLIHEAHAEWVAAVDFVGEYRGPQIGADKRSMTYRIIFQASNRSLSMDEVNQVVMKLVERLQREVGGVLRA
jgi:phenylalanyl-tRNA synthetase beta chain